MGARANVTAARERVVSVEAVLAASPQRIFDVLADPRQHPLIDGSDAVRRPSDAAPARLGLGATFTMVMRTRPSRLNIAQLLQVIGALVNQGRITNRVVEFDEGRLIAWTHFGGHVWRYELEPVTTGPPKTLVRETFDYTTSRSPWLLELAGFPAKNQAAMQRTLERLRAVM